MAYIGSSPTKVVSRQSANIFTYTAVANQVAFTGSDANGNTLACTPSDIMVHMNGLRLEESDFTASTTTVTLGSGAAAGDEVTITAFVTFETADAYTKSASDARYVNTAGDNMSGNLTTTGNVGVGETSPNLGSSGTGLHIKGAASKDGVIKLDSQTADRSGIVQFTENGTDKWRIGYDAASNHLEFTRSGVADRMLISDDGHVTMPSQPMFKAGRTTNYTPGLGNYIIFDGLNSAYQHNVGGHYSTSTGRFTAPVNGIYHFGCCILWGSVSDGENMADSWQFRKNGSLSAYSMRRAEYVNGSTGNGGYYSDFCFYDVKLDANDYISIYSQTGNQVHGNERYTWFYGHLVG